MRLLHRCPTLHNYIKTKREWVYTQPPKAYEMAPCACGNVDTEWSEYEGHLWCSKCQIDFIPEHGGIFDGPIPVNTASLLGITFNRFYIDAKELWVYNLDTLKYEFREKL